MDFRRILIVEDSPNWRLALLKALRSGDKMTVDVAPDCDSALEHIRHEDYDLVVVDLALLSTPPALLEFRQKGMVLLHELRARRKIRDCVVMVLSEYDISEYMSEVFRDYDVYLTKFTLADLDSLRLSVRAIEDALGDPRIPYMAPFPDMERLRTRRWEVLSVTDEEPPVPLDLIVTYVATHGSPTRPGDAPVEAPSSTPKPEDEGTNPKRYPSITSDGPARPGRPITITVDLLLEDVDRETCGGVIFIDLASDWTEIAVNVGVQSVGIEFETTTGIIKVRRNALSVPCTFKGQVDVTVKPGKPMVVLATFSHAGRTCGFARRDVATEAAAPQVAAVPREAGALEVDVEAAAPELTVKIFQLDPSMPGKLFWTLDVPRGADIPKLPGRLDGSIDLGQDTRAYVAALYARCAGMRPGEHLQKFRGIGEKLWQCAPRCFQETYWAMRSALGSGFTIQFITSDPHIPWELMRPYREDDSETADLLILTHPVARYTGEFYGYLSYRLSQGQVVTIAPAYARASDKLERAQEEAKMLREKFAAVPIEGKREAVWKLLEQGLAGTRVGIVHFAGHGEFRAELAGASSIKLEDGSLSADEVGTQEVRLGVLNGPVIVWNACEVGATGSVLGTIGGWAEAFLGRRFRGFIAPLWAVDDVDAAKVVSELFEALVNRRMSVGEALRDIRQSHGGDSPTYLAYLFYGDVMARFGGAAHA